MKNLYKLLDDHQLYHSTFQIDNLITFKSGITDYGSYKQALRELYKRVSVLREALCDDRVLDIEIKMLKREIKKETDDLKTELLQIRLVRKQLLQEESARSVNEIKRELVRFYKHSELLHNELVKQHGELTQSTKDKLEVEYWEVKGMGMMVNDILSSGQISGQSIEYIDALPKVSKDKLLQLANQPKILVDEYKRHYANRVTPSDDNTKNIECVIDEVLLLPMNI